jgi:hypothetical protein
LIFNNAAVTSTRVDMPGHLLLSPASPALQVEQFLSSQHKCETYAVTGAIVTQRPGCDNCTAGLQLHRGGKTVDGADPGRCSYYYVSNTYLHNEDGLIVTADLVRWHMLCF